LKEEKSILNDFNMHHVEEEEHTTYTHTHRACYGSKNKHKGGIKATTHLLFCILLNVFMFFFFFFLLRLTIVTCYSSPFCLLHKKPKNAKGGTREGGRKKGRSRVCVCKYLYVYRAGCALPHT
jgi:hypothetical protein